MKNRLRLSKNALKILAAVSMVIDHVGYVFFPQLTVLRIIGRLAFPIFAYSIYEGCRYTRNRGKYFLRVFLLGSVCFIGYFIYTKTLYFNVVISFSIAILIIYSLQGLKKQLIAGNKNIPRILLSSMLILTSVVLAYALCRRCEVDYGFWGIMLPVWAELLDISAFTQKSPEKIKSFEKPLIYAGFAAGLLLLASDMGGIQYYSLLALLPIVFTGSRRGKLNLKYFFYVFYPLHLLIIEGLAYLIK